MTAIVLRADARVLPLPSGSVDLIVTSPPYYGLRSYTDGGQHYAGQIGSEATPREWLQTMLACTREWMRVLKPTGSTPAVVLDPFGGTGTTALVAHALGRTGITVDRSTDYCRIARWRTTNPAQIAKAMRVETPPAEVAGQLDLFEVGGRRG